MAVFEARLNVNKLEGSENFHTWHIDIRALLRRDELWIFANSSQDESKGTPAYDEYTDKLIDAADLITLTLSDHVKAQMPSEAFDNGRLMLETLREQYQSGSVTDGPRVISHKVADASNNDSQMRAEEIEDNEVNEPNGFFKLPPELRNMVYELVLVQPSEQKYYLKQFYRKSTPDPGLLVTCKQIRQEASSIHYYNSKVVADIDLNQKSKELSQCMKQVQSIIGLCGQKPFKSFQIGLRGAVWDHLNDFLPLLELMRDTGFEPATQDYDRFARTFWWHSRTTTSTSIFDMPAMNMGNAQFVLEKALCLASRAHAEGWDAERLSMRFKEFVSDQSRPSRRGKKLKIMVEGKQL